MPDQPERPLNIAYDLRCAQRTGGGAVYTAQLLHHLVKNHPHAQWRIFYNPQSPSQQQFTHDLRRLCRQSIINLQPVRAPFLSLRQHLEFLQHRPCADLYHYPHFDAPLGLRQIPLVLTILDLYPLTIEGYCSPAKRAYFHYLTGANGRRAAAVITISQHSKNDIIEHLNLPEQKIIVTHLGCSDDFHPIADADYLRDIRQKYRLPRQFIFYCGNHKPHKNLPRLLQAYARLPRSLKKNFPLALTGKPIGPAGNLRTLADELNLNDNLSFLGWVDQSDLPALYNLASLLVLPSLYEGFGLPPLEALACGTPVACSHAAAIPEVVGDAGRLFDPYNIDQITATLAEALKHDVHNPQTRRRCLQHAARFSWKKTAQKTFHTYQTVMQKNI